MSCTLSQSLFGDCKNNKLFGGGIKSTITLFKFPETKFNSIDGLNSLVIDELFSPNRYDIDISNLDYSMSVSDNNFVHKLSGKIYNLDGEIQKALFETENDRYIVVFRPKGENLRGFGFSFGAVLSHEQVVGADENSYSITLEEKSPYSLFELDYNIFSKDKEYEPTYIKALPQCRLENGKKTGWVDYGAILKVNSAGEPLDRLDILCSSYSRPQAGYFREGVETEGYDSLGTYSGDEVIIGGVVYKTSEFNPIECQIETLGTFDINPNVIYLDSTDNLSASFSVDCDHNWSIIDKELIMYSELDKYSGYDGLTIVTAYNGKGGVDILRIQDLVTLEIKTVTIYSYIVNVPFYRRTLGPGELVFSIPVDAYGGEGDFIFESSLSSDIVTLEKRGNVIYGYLQSGSLSEDTILELTIKHKNYPDEAKNIAITFLSPRGTEAQWTAIGAYCEVEE